MNGQAASCAAIQSGGDFVPRLWVARRGSAVSSARLVGGRGYGPDRTEPDD